MDWEMWHSNMGAIHSSNSKPLVLRMCPVPGLVPATSKHIVFLSNFMPQGMEKAMAPHSSTLAWQIPWRRSLVGCSPWGRRELDMTERLPFHFSLSCIGEGNGNPLQCSCLENPRDGGAWSAAVYGVAQSRTWLKRLSSSSNTVFSLPG